MSLNYMETSSSIYEDATLLGEDFPIGSPDNGASRPKTRSIAIYWPPNYSQIIEECMPHA
jgi:hypothetical protein